MVLYLDIYHLALHTLNSESWAYIDKITLKNCDYQFKFGQLR